MHHSDRALAPVSTLSAFFVGSQIRSPFSEHSGPHATSMRTQILARDHRSSWLLFQAKFQANGQGLRFARLGDAADLPARGPGLPHQWHPGDA